MLISSKYVTIVLGKLNSRISHSSYGGFIQASVVRCNLHVSATSITEIMAMFWVKCPLHTCKSKIRLCVDSSWVHFINWFCISFCNF